MRDKIVFKFEEESVTIAVEHTVGKVKRAVGGRVYRDNRQELFANVSLDGFWFTGKSTHNPSDLFNLEKGIKLAIKSAIEDEGHSQTSDSIRYLGPEERKLVWDIFRKHCQFQKIAEGYKLLRTFRKDYGDQMYYDIKKHYGLEEAK